MEIFVDVRGSARTDKEGIYRIFYPIILKNGDRELGQVIPTNGIRLAIKGNFNVKKLPGEIIIEAI